MNASCRPMLLLCQRMRLISFPRGRTVRKHCLLEYATIIIVVTIVLLVICHMYACAASSTATLQLSVNGEYFGRVQGTWERVYFNQAAPTRRREQRRYMSFGPCLLLSTLPIIQPKLLSKRDIQDDSSTHHGHHTRHFQCTGTSSLRRQGIKHTERNAGSKVQRMGSG